MESFLTKCELLVAATRRLQVICLNEDFAMRFAMGKHDASCLKAKGFGCLASKGLYHTCVIGQVLA